MSEHEPPFGSDEPDNSEDNHSEEFPEEGKDTYSPWDAEINKLPLDDWSAYDMELEETLLLRDLSPEAIQNITEYFKLIHELVAPETTVMLFSEKLMRINEILEFFAEYEDDSDIFTYLQTHYSRLQQRRMKQMFVEEEEQRLAAVEEARIMMLVHQLVERILAATPGSEQITLAKAQTREVSRLVQPYYFEFKKENPVLRGNWTELFWQNESRSTEVETKVRQALADFGLL